MAYTQDGNQGSFASKMFQNDASRKDGDWTCPDFGNMNFSFRTVCNTGHCDAPKPSATPPAPVRSPYRNNPPFYYGGVDTPPPPQSIPHSGVPYDYGLYAKPSVPYSPISPFPAGSYGGNCFDFEEEGPFQHPSTDLRKVPVKTCCTGVWSPNACSHCSGANESPGTKTRFFNSSLIQESDKRGYPPKAPIFQIYFQGVVNNYGGGNENYSGVKINLGENSGNWYDHYTYKNHGGNFINNNGTFIGNGNGNGNGGSIGGNFDASTRNNY